MVAFVGLHGGVISEQVGTTDFGTVFPLLLDHLETDPFNIATTNFTYLSVFVMLYVAIIFAYYISKTSFKPTMPGQEGGTAKWNTNIKEYNKKFVMPVKKGEVDKNMILADGLKLTMERKPIKLSHSQKKLNQQTKALAEEMRNEYDVMTSASASASEKAAATAKLNKNKDKYNKLQKKLKPLTLNDRNSNVLIYGGSGTGKTRFEVKPNIMQANCSFVITDPKGEILEDTGDFLRKNGYEIKVFNLKDRKYSDCYNAFYYLKDESDMLTLVDTFLANTGGSDNKGDDFFKKAERSLLLSVCYYLCFERPMRERTWANVYKMITKCLSDDEKKQSAYAMIMKKLEKEGSLKGEHPAVVQYAAFKSTAKSEKTIASILSTCLNDLVLFTLSDVKQITSTDTMELDKVGDRKTAVFCVIPDDTASYNFMCAMLYTQLFTTLYYHADLECKGKKLPVHVRFILDEFANIGQIPDFEKKISTMRSRNISTTIILQSKSQLEDTYKTKAQIISDNCDTMIFIGGNGSADQASTLSLISGKLGKQTIVKENKSTDAKGKISKSYSYESRDLMNTTELATLPGNECIVMIRGVDPFRRNKFNLDAHPNYWMSKDGGGPVFYASKYLSTDERAAYGRQHLPEKELRKGYVSADLYSKSKVKSANTADIKPITEVIPEQSDENSVVLVSAFASNPETVNQMPEHIYNKYQEMLDNAQ